jgi:hypothetical protein
MLGNPRILVGAIAALMLGCGGTVINASNDAGDVGVPTDTDMPDSDLPESEPIHPVKVDKLDLLFVVDNSISMADKQAELARRVPDLIAAITNDPLKRITDIHVGVISTSLGTFGTSACDPGITNPQNDDRAHLLPRAGEALTSGYTTEGPAACPGGITSSSAVTWSFASSGAAGAKQLEAATSCVVQSAHENGCGYEATWEALYHFLVDPQPYAQAKVNCTFGVAGDACGSNKINIVGVDNELLAQRKSFLRADSFLAVVVMSDENDASLKPAGLNWIPWAYNKGQMQRGWTGCANVPDEFEPESAAEFNTLHTMYSCKSCFEDGSDPNCKKPWATDPFNNDIDGRNLRAFGQVKRFGYNFLYGRRRYVDAFTQPQVIGSDLALATNPIFAGGFRTKDMILVSTIVGVPSNLVQDAGGTAKTLTESDWQKIIGPVGVRDPHMIESIAPRAGLPHIVGDRSVDPINGGDRSISDGDDLQYACIAQRTVTSPTSECMAPDADKVNPLCDAGAQPYFKAFPGLRHLRIVHDLGNSGFAASICNASFAPAINGIATRILARIAK